jgi:hypothetical protein
MLVDEAHCAHPIVKVTSKETKPVMSGPGTSPRGAKIKCFGG